MFTGLYKALADREPSRFAAPSTTAGHSGLAGMLAAAGVQWVVVEHGTPGPLPGLSELVVVHVGHDVSLYRVPGSARPPAVAVGRVVAVATADAIAVLAVLATGVMVLRQRRTGRKT